MGLFLLKSVVNFFLLLIQSCPVELAVAINKTQTNPQYMTSELNSVLVPRQKCENQM